MVAGMQTSWIGISRFESERAAYGLSPHRNTPAPRTVQACAGALLAYNPDRRLPAACGAPDQVFSCTDPGQLAYNLCMHWLPMTDAPRPEKIADRIVDAILAGKLAPGARLGEQQLADLFSVSRTIVREALARLAARGMVEVNSRRGWFVVQPSRDAAREAFAARQVIETGLLQSLPVRLDPAAIKRLKAHIAQE